jgi:drug/metabolite transporter (DMT)-like permease
VVEPLRERGLLGRVLVAFLAIYLIWGSTFLAIRVAIDTIPPLLMCAVRLLSAGAILLAWAFARGERWPRGVAWRHAALVGILLPGIGNGSVTLGETRVASGLVALLLATIPLWMALLAAFGPARVRPGPQVLAGLLLGFGGTALLIGPGIAGTGAAAASPLWALVPVGGAFSWAWGSLWSRRVTLPASPVVSTGIGLVAGGAVLLVLSGGAGEWLRFDASRVSAASLSALAYLSVFGSVVGFSAYLYLLRTVSPAMVSTYAFVNPIVAMALGTLVLGEALSARMLVAAALVLASVVLITASRARRAAAAAASPQPVTSTRAEQVPEGVTSRAK